MHLCMSSILILDLTETSLMEYFKGFYVTTIYSLRRVNNEDKTHDS